MPELDWERLRQGKDAYRDRMAALPFVDKLRLLERLRARTIAVAGPSTARQRALASNLPVVMAEPARQVGCNGSGAANVGLFGANSTLAAAIARLQSPALTVRAGDLVDD